MLFKIVAVGHSTCSRANLDLVGRLEKSTSTTRNECKHTHTPISTRGFVDCLDGLHIRLYLNNESLSSSVDLNGGSRMECNAEASFRRRGWPLGIGNQNISELRLVRKG
eukprot:scaffold7178_cov80-Skeletonema_marinoi.AAC.3